MSKRARSANVDIAYEIVGEGTPLVLLHLIFDTREFWWRSGYVDAFRSAGRQLVLIDASGHGESSKPHDKEAYSLSRRADEVSIHHKLITDLATQFGLPAIYPYRFFVADGGLVSYGIDNHALWQKAAGYVDRILKGAKPAELPVQEPTKFELAINLKAAKALGLTVPPALLARADEVIE